MMKIKNFLHAKNRRFFSMKKKIKLIAILALILLVSFFLDKYVAQLIQLIKHPILDVIMEWFSHEITVFVILVIISALFLYNEKKKRYIPVLFTSFFLGIILSKLFKFIFIRPRPQGIEYMKIGFLDFNLKLADYSFPSTHATSAFSVLPILDKQFRKLQFFWIFFSVMIALSRIYLNEHYLSDIVAGTMLGYAIGYFLLKLEQKYGFAKKFFR